MHSAIELMRLLLERPRRRAGAALTPVRRIATALRDATGESRLRTLLRTLRVLLAPRRRVLFYPKTPSRHQIAWRLLSLCGYKMVTSPHDRYDVLFAFDPATSHPRVELQTSSGSTGINQGATDVSKRVVEAAFANVFGYDLGVDPRQYRGLAIRKSNENYRHDAVVVECPYEPAPDEGDVTYQKYVDTRAADGCFVDIRVPIYDGEVQLVYLKHHPDGDRRFFDVAHSEIAQPADVLSTEDLGRLKSLAGVMGVDYAEMDVLRDQADGRIYVVDVNPTPAGLYKGFTREQRQQALRTLAPAFTRLGRAALWRPRRVGPKTGTAADRAAPGSHRGVASLSLERTALVGAARRSVEPARSRQGHRPSWRGTCGWAGRGRSSRSRGPKGRDGEPGVV